MARMQTAFEFESFDPIPLQNHEFLDIGLGDGNALMALDTVAKYLFIDETGAPFYLDLVFPDETLFVMEIR